MNNTVHNPESDECSRLFAQALRGDADAATQLYAQCVPPLAGWLAQRISAHAAQEMAHEAMVEAFRKGDRFKPGHAFQVWLRTLAWHRALNILRNESRRRAREQAYLQLEQVSAAEEHKVSPYLERLESSLAALPAAERELLELHYLEGKTSRAIAEMHGRSRSAVAVHLHRVCRKLRTDIESARRQGCVCHGSAKMAA
jgi:RNA polymerase sigma factor (sigma-70 family)